MYNKEKDIILERAEKFLKRIRQQILIEFVPFEAEFARIKDPVPYHERTNLKYKKIKEGEEWGKEWDSAWFHLKGTVPTDWKGKEIVARLDFNGEALVFSDDGLPIQSLTKGCAWDFHYSKDIYYIFDKCKGGEKLDFWVETAANGLFGVSLLEDPEPDDPARHGTYKGIVNAIRLCIFDRTVWSLALDIEVLLSLAKKLPENTVRRDRIIRNLDEMMDAWQDNRENAGECRRILQRELQRKSSDSDLSAIAIGHAHIDTGWLWPVREGIRKCARTFASQITLIEKYPEYIFGASQAQHYAFVKQHYPKLYEKIKRYVKKGRWEIQGGMWVEADCNIISGESMIRQILHGKNFFMDEFGVDVKNLWLPDVFGYSAALPQILKKTGIDFFVTQKICWNKYNEFPYSTFKWRGVDGSEVIAHFPPENTYNSNILPTSLIFGRENFKEHDFIDSFLSLFGIGDGGGGPKEEYIERAIRQKDLEGVPRVIFGTAQSYLDSLKKYESRLESWRGELYLETHRGTLTTQARVKKANRKLEIALREAEFMNSMLPLSEYPAAELDKLWKILLLNQFHDIIPGSSIKKVYDVTHVEHAEALEKCEEIIEDAAKRIFVRKDDCIALVNTLSYPYKGVIKLPSGVKTGLSDAEGNELPVQDEGNQTVALIEVPPTSISVLWKTGKAPKAETPASHSEIVLENDLIRYEFRKDGTIKSIIDKEIGKQVIEPGKLGNLFSLYIDRPNQFDAWDIDHHYQDCKIAHAEPVEFAFLPSGPVRKGLQFKLKIGSSSIIQNVYLAPSSKRIDFETTVDWKERHKMLRVSFPVTIESDRASYDIQYSYVERPTHTNTQWDYAKFEVVAHRYADLSESDYGVAILNDCKYGHKIQGNVIDLNLLRSPSHPDPEADRTVHQFTYSLYPHIGTHVESDVMAEAAMLNIGVGIYDGYSKAKYDIPCTISGKGVSLEVVKKAEKENCIVIRLVETNGANSRATLNFRSKVELIETDLMEWKNGECRDCPGAFEVSLRPFEIRTYKVFFK